MRRRDHTEHEEDRTDDMMFLQNSGVVKLLNEDELYRIHTATLDVLENIGVRFHCASALRVFREAGFRIDEDDTVFFPPDAVEQSIRTVPPSFTRFPLDPTRHPPLRLGDGNVHFGTGSTTAYVLDLDGNHRKGTERDIANFARLSDAMEYLEIGNGMVWAQDVPSSVFHARYVEVLAPNNGKVMPAGDGLDQKTTEDIIRLAGIILGGVEEIGKKKTFTMSALPQRALTWSEEATVLIEAAKVRLPSEVFPMPLAGSMHPVTLTGSIVQGNAEALSGLVLSQIVNPGCPVIYVAWPGMMDMSALTNVFGCPEQALMCAAFAQLARYYTMPSNIIVGQTDAKIPDQQAGYEKMMGMLLAALAGADEIALVGGLINAGISANYEQVIIDDEIAGYVQRILKGIDVTEDRLAIDVIREVGHGGNFLEHEHTLEFFREEQHFARLSNRTARQVWVESGSHDVRDRAMEQARQIIQNHRTDHLPESVMQELEREVAAIYKREGEDYVPFRELDW